MALTLNTAELYFLKALIEDRVEDLDKSMSRLAAHRATFSALYDTDTPATDDELGLLIVRQCHANMLRKIELELDVPFPAALS